MAKPLPAARDWRVALFAPAFLLVAVPLAAQNGCRSVAFPTKLDGPRLRGAQFDSGLLRFESRLPPWICWDGSTPTDSARIAPTPASFRANYRSAYPLDRNNGMVWDGKGSTLAVEGGARYVRPHLRAMLAPEVAFQQNGDFSMAPAPRSENPLGYPYGGLDWPQRFGSSSFWTLDPGESGIVATLGPGELGIGTDNVWWGPARRYPLMMGNSSAGFPHLDIGLARAVSVGVADLRAHVLWGRLDESAYFDAAPEDDRRLLTGVFVEIRPDFFRGFAIGLSGMQHNRWSDAGRLFLDIVAFPFTKEEASEGNGLLSFTAEWASVDQSMTVYTEWARDDYWLDIEDLLTEPDHSQAYTIGFEKLYRRDADAVRFAFELAHLGMAAPEQTGRSYTGVRFYTHFRIPQGHSHRGQLLGAWIGPGSDAEYLAVDLERPERIVGVYAERVRYNEDEYYASFGDLYGFRGHDLEWTLGAQGLERAGDFEIEWQGGLSRRKNRGFLGLDGVNWDFNRETNLQLTVTGWWLPGL